MNYGAEPEILSDTGFKYFAVLTNKRLILFSCSMRKKKLHSNCVCSSLGCAHLKNTHKIQNCSDSPQADVRAALANNERL